MAEAPQNDVNIDQGPSPIDQGVTAESPPAPDVNAQAPAPSTGEPPAHEQTVPYERLKEEIDKRKELESLLASAQAPPEPPAPEEPPAQINWDLFPQATQPGEPPPVQTPQAPQQPQQQQAFPPEEIEQRIRDDMYQKPFQTLYPIMMEAAKQVYRDQQQRDQQVRKFRDFRDVEPIYYDVPDNLVLETQANPEIIRYLLAKNQASLTGASPPPPPASVRPAPTNGPANPPPAQDGMEALREQYRREGEERMLGKMRQQQGLQAEGTQTIPTTTGDQPELTAEQSSFIGRLGIKPDKFNKVAKRLEDQTRGR